MTSEHDRPSSGGLQNPSDEEELVLRAQQGHEQAFDELYGKYNNQISLYLARMVGNDNVGKDLTQETFMKAWRSLSTLRKPSRFRSWLYRIATNIAFNYQKRENSLKFISLEFYREKNDEPTIGGFEDAVSETDIIQQALAYVSPTYRPCLILYVVKELSQQEIADILDIKVNNVSKYVSRGKEDLRQVYHRLLNGQNIGKRKQGK